MTTLITAAKETSPEVETIFDNLPETGESKDFDKAVEKLTEYFSPKKNIMSETQVFRQAQQREDYPGCQRFFSRWGRQN